MERHWPHRQRMVAFVGMAVMLASLLTAPLPTYAAGDAVLFLRPHCELADQQQCPMFEVLDPTTLRTGQLSIGQTLDMDLVLLNPTAAPVSRVRTWLSYDAQTLEGVSVTISSSLPAITPGEADFSAAQGYVKIAASTDGGQPLTDFLLPIARVQMTVKSAPAGGQSPLSFYDVKDGIDGHTFVIAGDATKNILQMTQGSLIVRTSAATTPTASASSSASVTVPAPAAPASSVASSSRSSLASSVQVSSARASSVAVSTSSSASSTIPNTPTEPTQGVSFSLIQVQNVRAGSEGSALYITWDPLRSSQLRGYNVYYGTEPGLYAQRRQLAKEVTSTSINGLPEGTRYFVAVRAVSVTDEESAFSREVGVEIGNPLSSTNPLLVAPTALGNLRADLTAPRNPIGNDGANVPGAAGLPTTVILLVILSACIGMLIAFRRQFIALSAHP